MYSLLLLGFFTACLTDLASAQCDLQAAMNCLTGFQQAQSGGSTDMAAVCSSFQKAMTCLAPLKESCKSDATFQMSLGALTSVEPMCAGGDQCTSGFQRCYVDAGIDTTGGSNSEPTCDKVKMVQTCLMSLSTVCEGNFAYDQGKTSLQDVVSKCKGTVDAGCNLGLQKCYVDAGIDTTGGSNTELTCEDAKTVQTCLMSLSTVCEGNSVYNMSKTGAQDVVAKCTACNIIKECNFEYTFPNGIPSKPEFETGCSAIECMEAKYKQCSTDKAKESLIKQMKAFCMDANLKNGLETYKDCLAKSTINKDCMEHMTPKNDTEGNETEAEECMRIEEYAMCAKKGVMNCDNEGVQMFAADTARKVIMLKSSREGGIKCSTSAGVQAFPSFVLILAAALLTFAKAF